MTEPLVKNLRGKNQKFIWEQEQEDAFLKIIEQLAKEPVLKLPDYSKQFILKTDASGIGFGGCIVQVHNGKEHPVSFFSGTFNDTQRRKWNTWQKEAFAVVKGVKKYKHFLTGNKFKIVTDNAALLKLLTKPAKEDTNAMIDRWRIYLQSSSFEIEHRPGDKLVIEDGLSRSINFQGISLVDLKNNQDKDELIQEIKRIISKKSKDKDVSENISKEAEKLIKLCKDNLIIEDDLLIYLKNVKKHHYNLKRIVIPKNLEKEIIKMHHDSQLAGHFGLEKTY